MNKKLIVYVFFTLLMSCNSNAPSQTDVVKSPSTSTNEYVYHGSTYLYIEKEGSFENMGEGDVYSKDGNAYILINDKMYQVFDNNGDNQYHSYIMFDGLKVYSDV